MKPSSKFSAWPALGRGVLVLGALASWSGPAAQAQNIDEGKSATQLYAATCAACHRNPGALAKGRFRPVLFTFLHDHYTTSAAEAWSLASYLASVDAPARSRTGKKTSKRLPAQSN
ncbi:c-type cytochrome [Bradyrhizobium sp.]|jgi:mono/diheme cytochrome c family protein|uniref:c-type cytochrome n=1 Tax=Bradyrhizobium sp. TaxID=376 RepID=UPI003C47F51B